MSFQIEDPSYVLFGGRPVPEPGAVELHSIFDATRRLFGRSIEDVQADWARTLSQLRSIVSSSSDELAGDLKLDTVEVSLGFSASGRLVFVAEAGIEATVTLGFKRS